MPIRYVGLRYPFWSLLFLFCLFTYALPSLTHAAGFAIDTSGTLTTGLVSYYQFEDFTDSFSSNNLTNNNSSTLTASTPKIGKNVDFANTSSYLSHGAVRSSVTSNLSMFGWVYLSSVSSTGNFWADGDPNANSGNGNGYGLGVGLGGGNTDQPGNHLIGAIGFVAWLDFGSNIGTGWHQVGMTYDGTTWRGYIDGATTTNSFTGFAPNMPTNDFNIGKAFNNLMHPYFGGKVDELGFWNKVLSGQEIADLYNGGAGDAFGVPYLGNPLHQYRSDGTTDITEGSTTSESTIIFGATAFSGGTSTVQLQIQVATATANFDPTVPTTSSTFITSGGTANATISGLANGTYYWRARAVNSLSNSSTWEEFGTPSVADFTISVSSASSNIPFANDPGHTLANGLVSYYQFDDLSDSWGMNMLTNHSATLSAGGIFGDDANFGVASSSYLSLGHVLSPATTSFSMFGWVNLSSTSSTGDFWLNGDPADNSGNGNGYGLGVGLGGGNTDQPGNHLIGAIGFVNWLDFGCNIGTGWHQVGMTHSGSGWVGYVDGGPCPNTYATSTPLAPTNDFVIGKAVNNLTYPYFGGKVDEFGFWNRTLSSVEATYLYNGNLGDRFTAPYFGGGSLQQYQSDATTPISEGGGTSESTVVFGGKLQSSGTSTLQLQVELKPAGVSFSNVANVTSGFVSPGSSVTVTATDLTSERYHWQARVVDGNGASSTWQLFGGVPSATDFTVVFALSAHFNGSSSWAWPASNVEFTATDPWTIEFWYRTAQPTSSEVSLIDMVSSGTAEGYFVRRNMDQGIQFGIECDSGFVEGDFAKDEANKGFGPSYDLNGIWHYVAITKGAGTDASAFSAYFDGVPKSISNEVNDPVSGSCFSSTSTNSIWLGGVFGIESLIGEMDGVRISNTERSSGDIVASWNVETTSITGLAGLWNFNSTSTELVTQNATSMAEGNPSFSTSSPFGHFLLNQSDPLLTTTAHNNAMSWYSGYTGYGSEIEQAAASWNQLGGAMIVSTTSASSSDVVVYDINNSSYSWGGQWLNPISSPPSALELNTYQLNVPGTDFEYQKDIIMHELGHALGLDHSYLGNVMNWFVHEATSGTYPGPQDIIDYLYLKGQGLWGN